MLALGSRLVERGHEVTFETWTRWRDDVEAAGMHFVAAPEYPVFPTSERPLKPYEAVVRATAVTRRSLHERAPDVVVHDILTLAPALAGELEGIPVATLVPHVYPVGAPGLPPYALGARRPRSVAGRALWRSLEWPVAAGLRRGRDELNQTRAKLGLPPVDRLHGGLSERLCIVGTFPQLEYPRRWPGSVHVVGPLLWEPPYHDVDPPAGSAPLIVVAPSTAQDPQQRLLRAALAGLGSERVRVLATWNRRPPPVTVRVPANIRLVEWISYSRVDARERSGDLPRRSRDAGPSAGQRRSSAGRSSFGRHGRERRPGGLGWRGRETAVAAIGAANAALGRAAGAVGVGVRRAGARLGRLGGAAGRGDAGGGAGRGAGGQPRWRAASAERGPGARLSPRGERARTR